MTIGFFADSYGRERTISLASIVFIAGALLQAASYTVTQIVSHKHNSFCSPLLITVADTGSFHLGHRRGCLLRRSSALYHGDRAGRGPRSNRSNPAHDSVFWGDDSILCCIRVLLHRLQRLVALSSGSPGLARPPIGVRLLELGTPFATMASGTRTV